MSSNYIPAEEAATLKVVRRRLVYPHTYGLQYIQPYYRFIIQGRTKKQCGDQEPLHDPEEARHAYRFALVSAPGRRVGGLGGPSRACRHLGS